MLIKKIEVGYLKENCYVISINNECLIIDPGDDFNKIKTLVGKKRVLAVLITHYHFDHVGALNDVINYYHACVIDYKSNKKEEIGPFGFEILPTPGHKKDAVTYYFKNDKVMFVGDFIFKGTIGRCDLEGGSIKDMKDSIKLIKKYDKSIVMYPGHGNKTTLKDELKNNPYMKGKTYE